MRAHKEYQEEVVGEFNSQLVADVVWVYVPVGAKPGKCVMGAL